MWRIEFTSSKFTPELPEECQQNPGAYGFELAWWLAVSLARQGVATSYPLGEDWGWFIEFTDAQGSEYTIGCASISEPEEGQRGEPLQWSIFVKPHTTLKQRFKGESHETGANGLGALVVSALESEQIKVARVET
jgi:hypothetical protein